MLLRAARGLSSAGRHLGCALPSAARVAPLLRFQQLHASTPAFQADWNGRKTKPNLQTHNPEKFKEVANPHEGIMEFVDPYEVEDPDSVGEPGRQWRAPELRLKSNDDLQKLWIVLLKERNMLHSTRHMHRRRGTKMPYPGRIRAVQKSMGLIKRVLAERRWLKAHREKLIKLYKHNTPTFNVDLSETPAHVRERLEASGAVLPAPEKGDTEPAA